MEHEFVRPSFQFRRERYLKDARRSRGKLFRSAKPPRAPVAFLRTQPIPVGILEVAAATTHGIIKLVNQIEHRHDPALRTVGLIKKGQPKGGR